MICNPCGAAGALNKEAYYMERHKVYRYPKSLLQTMKELAVALHEACPDSKCPCQHKAEVVTSIDWTRVNVSRNEQKREGEVRETSGANSEV